MLPFYFFFLLIFGFSACETRIQARTREVIFWGLAVLLILFAGLRSSGVDLDYEGYRHWFDEAPALEDYAENLTLAFQRDPGYLLACSFFKTMGLRFEDLIFSVAVVAVTLKMSAIWRMSMMPLLSVLLYFSYMFILQEMTQIRAGLAAAIFLCGIPYLVDRKLIRYSLVILVAAAFHYSALILLLFAFLGKKTGGVSWYLLILLLSVVLAAMGYTLDFIFLRAAELGFDSRLSFYAAEAGDSIGTTNIFNSISIPNLLLSVLLLLNYGRLVSVSPYASYVIRIQVVSVIVFFLFSGYPVMAFRLSELAGVVGVLAWPMLGSLFRAEWVRVILFFGVCADFLVSNLRIVQDYF